MSKLLNDNTKFELLHLQNDKEFNYVLNLEKNIINVFKELENKEEISKFGYNHLYPSGSYPAILHGLAKVYKPVTDQSHLL